MNSVTPNSKMTQNPDFSLNRSTQNTCIAWNQCNNLQNTPHSPTLF